MREILPEQLWISNAIDARDISAVLQHGVQAVIDLAIEEKPAAFPRDILYCRIPLNDGDGNRSEFLRVAVETATQLIATKCPTLICCGAGMSRSPAVAAMAIARLRGDPPENVLTEITANRPHDVSPILWGELCRAVAPG
jgi:protein-tyrosine phosphatase